MTAGGRVRFRLPGGGLAMEVRYGYRPPAGAADLAALAERLRAHSRGDDRARPSLFERMIAARRMISAMKTRR